MKNLKNIIKIEDVLIYFGISAVISAVLKALFKKENFSVFLNALAMTFGWGVGKIITNYIDEKNAE
ncbi:MAG: hypothetical protein NC253_09390 [Ruminococcus sp.]|nr:hypothetical protein [Ruminococcus sp.]MCM1380864.1 hypothetical protein [Muribaculaceae bacterium]MCM1480730.1 hypothetical protein [Muribaculaceae bacterium]